eukprot:9207434-Pyramimonas_sp.AAC.1
MLEDAAVPARDARRRPPRRVLRHWRLGPLDIGLAPPGHGAWAFQPQAPLGLVGREAGHAILEEPPPPASAHAVELHWHHPEI